MYLRFVPFSIICVPLGMIAKPLHLGQKVDLLMCRHKLIQIKNPDLIKDRDFLKFEKERNYSISLESSAPALNFTTFFSAMLISLPV
jgi:hypothetical protein